MGATVSQVRGWVPADLVGHAAHLMQVNEEFDDLMTVMARTTVDALDHWEGEASTAASARSLADRLAGTHLATAVAAHVDAIGQAAQQLGSVRTAVLATVDSALAEGFGVEDNGAVIAPMSSTGSIVPDLLLQASFDERARVLHGQLLGLLVSAAEIDSSCAAALQRAVDAIIDLSDSAGDAERYGHEVRAVLDGTALLPEDPQSLAQFWDALTPAEKDGLAAWDPTIGNRDGLPAVDKSRYNQDLLPTLITGEETRLAEIENRHPDWLRGENLPPTSGILTEQQERDQKTLDAWLDEREAASTAVAGYRQVQTQMDTMDDGVPRFLMTIDDQGRGAIALNNPDTAVNVATMVPGTGTELSKMGNDMARAGNLLEAADREDPTGNSVVAWMGYNAPSGVYEAGSADFADAGGPRLDSFQDGLRAAHEGAPSHNTVIGHSYGSTVLGHAMREGNSLAADDVVFAGSPGVGVSRVGELALDGVDPGDIGNHVYATSVPTDPVGWIGHELPFIHGTDPSEDYFGSTVFESAQGDWSVELPVIGQVGLDLPAHSNYFEPGSPSLQTMAEIVAGTGRGS